MADIATLGIKVLSDDIVKATKRLDALENQAKGTEKANKKLGSSFGGLKAAIGALGLGLLTKQLISSINTYTALNNKLKLVTSSAKNLADVQGVLFDVAQDTRGSLEGTIDLYSKLARSTKDLELSQSDLADVTETINQAIAVSGATANEANAAIFQLGQGLSAGALRGEELNSVMEQTPRLAQAMADGLGVGIAELRKMGSEGKLNSEIVIKALQNQSSTIRDEFNQTEKTVAQAFQQIENVALKTFGSLDSKDLIDSLDEFRTVISDPKIVAGLQDLAGALLSVATLLVKVASGFGDFFSKLSSGGENMGRILANALAKETTTDRLQEINERMVFLAGVMKRTSSAFEGSPMSKEFKQAKEDLVRLSAEWQKLGGDSFSFAKKIAAPEQAEIAPEVTGGALIDNTLSKSQETELERLKNSLATEETLLTDKYIKSKELLDSALLAERITKDEHMDLLFESDIRLFDRQQELAELERIADEEKLEAKNDYYERLYNMQSGSLQAGADFAKAIRDGDAKAAVDNGALMLGNLAKTNKAAFEIQKAFSLAKAIATLPSAVIDSFNNGGGYPWGIVPAGLMLATGLKQIKAIQSTSFGSKSVGTASVGGGGGTSPSAPVASGLPAGSTALPSGDEQRRPVQDINVTFDGDNLHSEAMRSFVTSLSETIEDMGGVGRLVVS